MTEFQYTTLPQLLASGVTGGFTFLLRHAERFPIRSRTDVLEAGLTGSGWEAARQLGRHLEGRTRIGVVYSSPVGRCVDTARSILEAAGKQQTVQLKWWLFSPFLHAPEGWSSNGSAVDVTHQGRLAARVPDGRLDMLLARLKLPAREDTIHLYVAHDTTVILALAHLLGARRVDSSGYPGYLQGIALRAGEGGIQLLLP